MYFSGVKTLWVFFVVFFLSAINIKIPKNKLVDIYRMSVKDFCIDVEK